MMKCDVTSQGSMNMIGQIHCMFKRISLAESITGYKHNSAIENCKKFSGLNWDVKSALACLGKWWPAIKSGDRGGGLGG